MVGEGTNTYAFIADVGLAVSIQWSGQIRARWEHATARAESKASKSKGKLLNVPADGYVLRLRALGQTEVLQEVNTTDLVHDFGGVIMGAEYEVDVECVFGERRIPCGTEIIASGTAMVHFRFGNSK